MEPSPQPSGVFSVKDSKGKGQLEIMSKQRTENPSPEFDQENNERLAKQSRDKGREGM